MIRPRFLVGAILVLALGYWHLNRRITETITWSADVQGFQNGLMGMLMEKTLEVHALDERVKRVETTPAPPCADIQCVGVYVIRRP